ncbi:hypothetical protein D3C87_1138330 [compost metagenome]
MKVMIPRFGVLLITVLLAGCGLELLSPIQKLTTSGNSGGLQYSWPVDFDVPVGSLSLSLDDPAVVRSVFGDLTVLPGHDERLHLLLATQELEPIRFAEKFALDAPLSLDLPPQSLPEVDASLPDLSFPEIHLGADELVGSAVAPGVLIPINLNYSADRGLAFPDSESDFKEARVGTPSGHLEFTVENRLGVRFAPSIKLYASQLGATRELGRTQAAVPIDPGQSRKLTIPLNAGATLTPDLSLRVEIFVPGGQQAQAPVSGVTLTNVLLVTKTLSHLRVEVPTKSIDVPPMTLDFGLDDPAYDSATVRSLEVDDGTLELTLRNGFPVAATVALEFQQFFRPGQSVPMRETIDLKAGENRVLDIPLAGVRIRPQDGKIAVTARATTKDTGPAGALMALDSSQSLSGRVVLRAPLRFRAIEVPVTRTVALPAKTMPIQLPTVLTDQGIGLQDVVLRLELKNGSAIAGNVDLDVKASIPGKGDMPLTDKAGQPVRLPIAANQANELRVTAQNSNLLDLLNAKPTSLAVGGQIVVDSKGQPVRLAASDAMEGRLNVEIPLSLTFQAFGGDAKAPAIDVKPPTPLTFTSENREHLNRVERAVLKLNIDNGWGVPLDLDLLFSGADDPFSDSEIFVQTVSLGNPGAGYRVNNQLTLEGESLKRFRSAKMLGMRLRSPGSTDPVTIFRGSTFRVNLGLAFKAVISSKQDSP